MARRQIVPRRARAKNPENICTGQEPTDISHETEVVKQAAHDVADAGDDASGLEDLMGDLDALIKEV